MKLSLRLILTAPLSTFSARLPKGELIFAARKQTQELVAVGRPAKAEMHPVSTMPL
jgi:hypothetical protein